MAGTLKQRIIGLLADNLDKFYSISDISKELKVAYSHAHTFVNQLKSEQVIRIQKIGNASVCKLNMDEQLTLVNLAMMSYKKTLEWKQKDKRYEKLKEKSDMIKDKVHCVLVHNNKIILVVPDGSDKEGLDVFQNRSVINREQLKKNSDFYKNAIILHGAEKYWSLLK